MTTTTRTFVFVGALALVGGAAATAPRESRPLRIAPPGVPVDAYHAVPAAAQGPPVDPAKGYRLQDLGGDLYMVTDNIYQAMFLVYDTGVVLVDAPQTLAPVLTRAVAERTNKPITHVVYSHSHLDHIGGMERVPRPPTIVAHTETRRLLERANDPRRPLPTTVFEDRYELRVGAHVLQLAYYGNGHVPGNVFIYAPAQRVLMAVDLVFPGWTMWRHFALAQDLPGYFALVEKIKAYPFETLVSGHVTRTGTRADVDQQLSFMHDLRRAAARALETTRLGDGVRPRDAANPWAVVDVWMDAVVAKCVDDVSKTWAHRLGGFDVFIWDHCIAMQESLQVE
jgi:glyoxylase-like metal-dependent hydrolase (beta-lactamase superfamily II)